MDSDCRAVITVGLVSGDADDFLVLPTPFKLRPEDLARLQAALDHYASLDRRLSELQHQEDLFTDPPLVGRDD